MDPFSLAIRTQSRGVYFFGGCSRDTIGRQLESFEIAPDRSFQAQKKFGGNVSVSLPCPRGVGSTQVDCNTGVVTLGGSCNNFSSGWDSRFYLNIDRRSSSSRYTYRCRDEDSDRAVNYSCGLQIPGYGAVFTSDRTAANGQRAFTWSLDGFTSLGITDGPADDAERYVRFAAVNMSNRQVYFDAELTFAGKPREHLPSDWSAEYLNHTYPVRPGQTVRLFLEVRAYGWKRPKSVRQSVIDTNFFAAFVASESGLTAEEKKLFTERKSAPAELVFSQSEPCCPDSSSLAIPAAPLGNPQEAQDSVVSGNLTVGGSAKIEGVSEVSKLVASVQLVSSARGHAITAPSGAVHAMAFRTISPAPENAVAQDIDLKLLIDELMQLKGAAVTNADDSPSSLSLVGGSGPGKLVNGGALDVGAMIAALTLIAQKHEREIAELRSHGRMA